MLDLEFNGETKTAKWEAFAASSKQDNIGDRIITTRPGRVGHNYITFVVISREVKGDMVMLTGIEA